MLNVYPPPVKVIFSPAGGAAEPDVVPLSQEANAIKRMSVTVKMILISEGNGGGG
ncbi:MAG: hypothetical protein LBB81_10635 [Treponema sp.]|jgi:hypothetical protein|nr:hypothetical protein [Treponema sp.]